MPYNEGMQCFSLCGKQKIRKGERIYEHENEKAIATLLTRFYADGELTDKSDAELEALMHE